jgi:two-component system response regulator RegA
MMMHKTEHKLLIVDDDESLLGRLARVMERKGFVVTIASCIPDARDCIKAEQFTHAILDLKLEQGSGLDIVQILKDNQPDCRVVMLTGFGNIATAVSAVKAGAVDYLP